MNQVYILLATNNGEKYLKEQLNSLFRQTYQNWVLWIHDDNSKDNTVSIINHYKSKYPEKIKFLDDDISTGGAKENFTYLLNNIDDDYDYIMFCDQDDVWLENKIEITLKKMVQVEDISKNKPVLIHTDLYLFHNVIENNYERFMLQQSLNSNFNSLNRLFMQNIVTGCTMMINKNCIKSLKKIPKEAIMHDWWIAIYVSVFGKICFLDEATILYRQHDNNTIGAQNRDLKFVINKILNPTSLKSNFLQIQKFKMEYATALDDYNKRMIDIFLSLQNQSYFKSRYLMLTHKIYKHGIMRNLALFMGVVKL